MTPIENHIHAAKEYLYLAKTWKLHHPNESDMFKKVRNENRRRYIRLAEAQVKMAELYVDTDTNIFYKWF